MIENFLEFERGSTKSHSVRTCFWKRLWTCLKTPRVTTHHFCM